MRPDASRMRRDASRMRRDFEFQQISANSGKIPANFGQNLANWTKNGKKNSKKFSSFLKQKFESRERCKGVQCVDLGESFPTFQRVFTLLVLAKFGFDTAENEP